MADNVSEHSKLLHTDNSLVSQPKGTTRFVLNGVSETNEGDQGFISNEEANEICYNFPVNYIPLGKVYIGDGETLIFSVRNDESLSEIGVTDKDTTYTTLVNGDLGFKISHQIQATFRLRRGCEKVVYWTDPRVRVFNISKPEDFKNSQGNWDPFKFRLFKTYTKIPTFETLEIVEGGNLMSGSYNISIQYLDEDLNPTEWITTSQTLVIYNDNITKDYTEIRASSSLITDYQNFGTSNKAIKVKFGSLDNNYPFYRVAIVEANSGTGLINNVSVSQEIPTEIDTYTYTGIGFTTIPIEEIQLFNNIIEYAEHIEQIENKLLLANTKGKQVNFCRLQKHASKITADLTTKQVILNSISESNPKTSTVYFDGTGYMPGEIYSFGVVWVFDDGTISPTYHIPGKNHATVGSKFGAVGFPMSINNELEDTFYTDNNSCGTEDYWGLDSEGITLLNRKVRHHRFPSRSEVNKPLVVKDATGNQNVGINQLSINIQGTINIGYTPDVVEYSIEYSIEGNTFIATRSFNKVNYDPLTGLGSIMTSSTKVITVINIYENGVIATNPAPSGLSYTSSTAQNSVVIGETLYTTDIFGIKFSGIEIPPIEDTNGEKIIGYYIVRNERNADNRTILDSAILAPLLDEPFYIGHAHLLPRLTDTTRIKTDVFALIHPEYSFFKQEYKNANKIVKEGEFVKQGNSVISDLLIQDTMAGTSFDPEIHRRRDRDSDGFDLHIMARDNEVDYVKTPPVVLAEGAEIEEIFYLDTLNSKVINDINDVKKEVFNVSADNKVGIVKLDKQLAVSEVNGKLPYVILQRSLSNPYANFRVSPYYQENKNVQTYLFNANGTVSFGNEISVFNGDVVITPLRYTTSSFYDIKTPKRGTKKGLFNFIIAAVAIVVGVLLIPFTGGGSLAVAALGVSAIGLGITQIATGLKKETMGKVWGELYDAGLRDTIQDNDTISKLDYGPNDDEVQWFSDTVTNLWFESTANMALRQGTTINIPDFLNAPAKVSSVATTSRVDTSQNEVDSYILDKITNLDMDNSDGRLYQGFANAELYEINKDYLRRNREKLFSHLGIEYDCCSDCIETFPNRIHYSETAFQEELTDNYRVFLPNNYTDIEAEHGVITNIYRFYDNIYIHTAEAIWKAPKNYQERVTDEIVSFIGTGSFFELPPQKMVEGEFSSAGTLHKEGHLKTKHGILFPSEQEGKWYLFNGNEIEPISDGGNSKWFRENMKFLADEQYYSSNKRRFEFADNPSNIIGTGYISTYDTNKERFIITKKDYSFSDALLNNPDYRLCTSGASTIIFNGYLNTINNRAINGFTFESIENCSMKFSKSQIVSVEETRTISSSIPNTADIIIAYDTSGSFTASARLGIKAIVDAWLVDFQLNNPSWTGTLHHYETGPNSGENWIGALDAILNDPLYPYYTPPFMTSVLSQTDIVMITFTNESGPVYHNGLNLGVVDLPEPLYISDYNTFLTRRAELRSFTGIAYPIVFSNGAITKIFLQHQLAALKGVPYTLAEAANIAYNPGFTQAEWDTLLLSLQTSNPYPDNGLEQYGWSIITNRFWNGTNQILTASEFSESVNSLLQGSQTTQEITVSVDRLETVFEYVQGVAITSEDLISHDASWTMSYSLKDKSWIGWHSYTPDFYFYQPERFYAWQNESNNIWRFNKVGQYQTYFGTYYPHIIEYVSVSSPLPTRLWNGITLQTEAKQLDLIFKEYVDRRFITFNKLLVYNSRQISGILNLLPKDIQNNPENYIQQQIVNAINNILIDRNEKDWSINDLRDIRVNHDVPMFRKDLNSISSGYYIDKVVNPSAIDFNKDWTQMENFRDKYLVIRLIFDTFDNIRLITNYSVENEEVSHR